MGMSFDELMDLFARRVLPVIVLLLMILLVYLRW